MVEQINGTVHLLDLDLANLLRPTLTLRLLEVMLGFMQFQGQRSDLCMALIPVFMFVSDSVCSVFSFWSSIYVIL